MRDAKHLRMRAQIGMVILSWCFVPSEEIFWANLSTCQSTCSESFFRPWSSWHGLTIDKRKILLRPDAATSDFHTMTQYRTSLANSHTYLCILWVLLFHEQCSHVATLIRNAPHSSRIFFVADYLENLRQVGGEAFQFPEMAAGEILWWSNERENGLRPHVHSHVQSRLLSR